MSASRSALRQGEKANKDMPDTCGDLILGVKCINIEITKEALCLSSKKIELYLFISAEKEYPTGLGEVRPTPGERRTKAIVIYTYFSIKKT